MTDSVIIQFTDTPKAKDMQWLLKEAFKLAGQRKAEDGRRGFGVSRPTNQHGQKTGVYQGTRIWWEGQDHELAKIMAMPLDIAWNILKEQDQFWTTHSDGSSSLSIKKDIGRNAIYIISIVLKTEKETHP